jgi:hypothetical protein
MMQEESITVGTFPGCGDQQNLLPWQPLNRLLQVEGLCASQHCGRQPCPGQTLLMTFDTWRQEGVAAATAAAGTAAATCWKFDTVLSSRSKLAVI